MKSTEIPCEACVVCGYEADTASSAEGGEQTPQERDVTLCMACGRVYVFSADLSRRPMMSAELDALPEGQLDVILRMQKGIRKLMDGKRVVAGRIVDA